MSRIVCAAMLAIAAAAVYAQNAEEKKPVPPEFPPRMNLRAEALKEFDKDGDGKLNDDERKTMMEARAKEMGNGPKTIPANKPAEAK